MALKDCACFSGFPVLPFRGEVIRKLFNMPFLLIFCSGNGSVGGDSDLNFVFCSDNFQSGWSVNSSPLSVIRGVSGDGSTGISGAVGLQEKHQKKPSGMLPLKTIYSNTHSCICVAWPYMNAASISYSEPANLSQKLNRTEWCEKFRCV